MFKARCVVAAAMVMSLTVFPSRAAGQHAWTSGLTRIRVNGQDLTVTFNLAAGEATEYWNDENCGNTRHKTRALHRFDHIHFEYYWPKPCKDIITLTDLVVDKDTIFAYWQNKYDGYSNVFGSDPGGESPTDNCHAFAFTYDDCWIQDPSYIYADDLEMATNEIPSIGV